mgnify:CR=1 FL=1
MNHGDADVDVLIVGMGPVGAALAQLLNRHGTRALVVDKSREIFMAPRAIALDNEALRVLQMCGLEDDAFDKIAIPEVRMHSPLFGQYSRAVTAGASPEPMARAWRIFSSTTCSDALAVGVGVLAGASAAVGATSAAGRVRTTTPPTAMRVRVVTVTERRCRRLRRARAWRSARAARRSSRSDWSGRSLHIGIGT